MAVKTAAELKAYFETGDVPTQQEFVDLIDTIFTGVPDYKSYVASVYWSGTNVTGTEIFNDLDNGITVIYDSQGFIKVNSPALSFTSDEKVYFTVLGGSCGTSGTYGCSWSDTGNIFINFRTNANNNPAGDVIKIKIEVYN